MSRDVFLSIGPLGPCVHLFKVNHPGLKSEACDETQSQVSRLTSLSAVAEGQGDSGAAVRKAITPGDSSPVPCPVAQH